MERVSRTKLMLAKSLKDLMITMPFSKITVQNVTDHCGLNRQTFYYHCRDMTELLVWVYDYELFAEIRKDAYNDWELGVQYIIRYANANKAFCRNTVRSIKKEDIECALMPIVHRWVEVVGDELSHRQGISIRDTEFFVRFFTMAFVDYGIEWVRRGMMEDEETIIGKIKLLISLLDKQNASSGELAI